MQLDIDRKGWGVSNRQVRLLIGKEMLFSRFNLLVVFVGLAVFVPLAISADTDWKDQALRRQQALFRAMNCSTDINAKADALVKHQDTLPEHLRRSNVGIKFDPRDLEKSIPKDVLSKMPKEVLASLKRSDMSNRDEMYKRDPPGFMSKTNANLSITNGAGKDCSKECESSILRDTIAAVALWKSACLFCVADHLSFLQTPDGLFVDTRIAEWLTTSKKPSAGSFPLLNSKVSFFKRMEDVSSSGSPLIPITDQDKDKSVAATVLAYVTLTSEMRDRVCSLPYSRPDTARALKALVAKSCGTSAPEVDKDGVALKITLMPNETSCGPASEFYACGRPDNAIELTFSKLQYTFPNPVGGPDVVFGQEGGDRFSGPNTLLHEVGHWFGLPHIQDNQHPDPRITAKEIPDIMQSHIGKTVCTSQLSMWLINNMSDQAYQNRFRAGGGLRRTN